MQQTIQRTKDAGIPIDIAVADIDYMDRYKDFTIGQPVRPLKFNFKLKEFKAWSGLSDYVKQLHQWGMRIILIWDPAIEVDYASFQRAMDQVIKTRTFEYGKNLECEVHRMGKSRSSHALDSGGFTSDLYIFIISLQDQYPLAKDTKIMLGVVWPDKHVAFPDFFDPTNATTNWWVSEFKQFYQQVPYLIFWLLPIK